jgi:hypothetical protein
MKRITPIKRMSLNSFLILILVATSILALPRTLVFSETGVNQTIPPLRITINTPSQNEWIKNLNVTVSGNYSVNDVNILSKDDLFFSAYEGNSSEGFSNSTRDTTEWNISPYDSNGNGTWTFSGTLLEGRHDLKIEIMEKNHTDIKSNVPISFSVGDRPYITEAKIIFPDNIEYNAEDLTSVPTNGVKMKLTLVDNKPTQGLKNDIEVNGYSPIKVMLGSTSKIWTVDKNNSQLDNNVYTLILTPSEDLILNSTYLVSMDPQLTDDDNNLVLPFQFKFTTKSNMSNKNNPHGSYVLTSNGQPSEDHTYLCANCHSTHIGSNPSLEGGVYQNLPSNPNLVTWGSENGLDYSGVNQNLIADPSINYCMACHDGTMNAPLVENINKTYHHSSNVADSSNRNDFKQTDSCTICHNPHLSWAEGNPNMLKDHFIYTSNVDNTKKIDSLDVSCGACHDDNAVYNINEYNTYENHILTYKKSTTADGKSDNYSLCLRCHNADKAGVSNIKSFYEDPTSLHRISALDGKSLTKTSDIINDGHLPCAECHDTHGSDNLFNLKENFGHENPDPGAFSFTDGNWLNKEKEFCLKCHKGATAIYGVTGKKYDETRVEHINNSDKACSYCHGGSGTDAEKALRAAHDPQTGVVPPPAP